MQKKQIVIMLTTAMAVGAIGGSLLSPAPVGAVAKEMIELLTGVNQIQQSQRDMQSALDTKFTVMKTLIDQQNDSMAKLNATIGALQKTMQDLQANSGTRLDSMTTQVSGVADNMGEVQTRIGHLNSQLTDMQNTLQTLDSKISALAQPQQPANSNPASGTGTSSNPVPGTTPATTTPQPNNPPASTAPPVASTPPVSSETLYKNALNDWLTKKYDLSQQEFEDYLKYYPNTDYASNALYYLGEISFAQQHYAEALDRYSDVLDNFPKSFKLASALYKRGMTYIALGKKPNGIADLREVIRRHPNSDEDKLARQKLREMGVSIQAAGR